VLWEKKRRHSKEDGLPPSAIGRSLTALVTDKGGVFEAKTGEQEHGTCFGEKKEELTGIQKLNEGVKGSPFKTQRMWR